MPQNCPEIRCFVEGECGNSYSGLSANWFDEFDRSDVQAVRQLHDVNQADVSLPTFDPAHIVAVQVGQFRELLL